VNESCPKCFWPSGHHPQCWKWRWRERLWAWAVVIGIVLFLYVVLFGAVKVIQFAGG
jgi:hypothetical protein